MDCRFLRLLVFGFVLFMTLAGPQFTPPVLKQPRRDNPRPVPR